MSEKKRATVEEDLINLQKDIKSLLKYSQKLETENKTLRTIIKDAVVFFESPDIEELYNSIVGKNNSFPVLRTVTTRVHNSNRSYLLQSHSDGESSTDFESSTMHRGQTAAALSDDIGKSDHLSSSRLYNRLSSKSTSSCESGGHLMLRMWERMSMDENEATEPLGLYVSDLVALLRKIELNRSNGEDSLRVALETHLTSLAEENIMSVCVTRVARHQNSYMFAVCSTWTNGQKFELLRKYEDFFRLQRTLQQMFEEELSKSKQSQSLPLLPLKDQVLCTVGRLSSKRSLQTRVETVNNFCKAVAVDMEASITHSEPVISFFTPVTDDVQLPSIRRGTSVCFLRLTRQLPAGSQFMECRAIANYNASSDNELTFKQGEMLTLLDQETTGWALALKPQGEQEGGKRAMGYVPCSYLKQIHDGNEFENTAELEEDCLGFVSSLAAQEEKEWLSTYGSSCGLPTPCPLSPPPTHKPPTPLPKHQPLQYASTTPPSPDHKHPFSSPPTHTDTELRSHPPLHRLPSPHILSPTRKDSDPHSSPPPAHQPTTTGPHSSLSGHVPFIAKLRAITDLTPPQLPVSRSHQTTTTANQDSDPSPHSLPGHRTLQTSHSVGVCGGTELSRLRSRRNDFCPKETTMARRKALAIRRGSTDWETTGRTASLDVLGRRRGAAGVDETDTKSRSIDDHMATY